MSYENILGYLRDRILSCHRDMMGSIDMPIPRKLKVENFWCFYSRLDELLLFYGRVLDISYVAVCRVFGINYGELEGLKEEMRNESKL